MFLKRHAHADANNSFQLTWEHLEVTSQVKPDEEALGLVTEYAKLIAGRKLNKIIGKVHVPLDARFQTVRTEEAAISNWIVDVVRDTMRADVCLINSGTLRIDDYISAGDLTMRTFVLLLPMTDDIVVIGLTGALLLDGLENGVSAYPRTEGRFPMVSGVRFSYRSTAPPGSRVVRDSVTVNGEPLDLRREYSVATKLYLANGKDGFTCFPKGRVIVGETEASILPNIIRNRFMMMQVVEAFRSAETPEHKAHDVVCAFLKKRKTKLRSRSEVERHHREGGDEEHKIKKTRSSGGIPVPVIPVSHSSSPTPSPPPSSSSSKLNVSESFYHDGHQVSSSGSPAPPEVRRRRSLDDIGYLENSDSELDLNECYELSAHVDGRITRLDA